MAKDVLNKPRGWERRPLQPVPLPRKTTAPGRKWISAGFVLLAILALIAGSRWHPRDDPVPSPPRRHLTVRGPLGPVMLQDHPLGPHWLSWYERHHDWVGEPLWVDRPFRERASCAAFINQIVCWNPEARGSEWEITPALLGTYAMLRMGLEPDPTAQPAPVVASHLMKLAAEGEDTWYRFGGIQSPDIIVGDKGLQFYQLAQFEWTITNGSPDLQSLRVVPLGKLAVEQKW